MQGSQYLTARKNLWRIWFRVNSAPIGVDDLFYRGGDVPGAESIDYGSARPARQRQG